MQLQFHDGREHPTFNTTLAEPAWLAFRDVVRGVLPEGVDDSSHDIELSGASLASVVEALEGLLATTKQEVLALKPVPGAVIEREVLGTPMQLNPRVEAHGRLERLNELVRVLSEAQAQRRALKVLRVPPLTSLQCRLALLLKLQPAGLAKNELQSAIHAEYERLIGEDIASDELRSAWRREQEALADVGRLDEAASYLEQWSLATESDDGARLIRTAKLSMIVL